VLEFPDALTEPISFQLDASVLFSITKCLLFFSVAVNHVINAVPLVSFATALKEMGML
jgi:hypothetical protein